MHVRRTPVERAHLRDAPVRTAAVGTAAVGGAAVGGRPIRSGSGMGAIRRHLRQGVRGGRVGVAIRNGEIPGHDPFDANPPQA